MALPPINEQEFLKRLGKIAAPKQAATSSSSSSSLAALSEELAKSKPQSSKLSGFLQNPLVKYGVAPVLKYGVLKPLQTIDTPRRAIISGVRELVDVYDNDATTKASWRFS